MMNEAGVRPDPGDPIPVPRKGQKPSFRPGKTNGWELDIGAGPKVSFAYDKRTKLSLRAQMWAVKVGVSQKFGAW